MITIDNENFSAYIIDPRIDTDKLGSRYCAGGYVWQVYDKSGNALLSGPHFPLASPPVFDGQGMPEVFETPLGGSDCAVGGDVCVIGVGIVRKSSDIEPFHTRDNPHITKPCLWDIDTGDDFAVMVTEQKFGDKSIQLRREVRLVNNRINSITVVKNTGRADVDIRWFSHPFFPLNPDLTCGKISAPVSMPENAGYCIDGDGTIRMKSDYQWKKGLFQLLDVPQTKLIFTIPHPIVSAMKLIMDYDVIRCPVWANANTFSFEPFISRIVEPDETTAWTVSLLLSYSP